MEAVEATQLVVTSGTIGAFLPIFIGFVNRYLKSKTAREIVAIVISLAVGALVAIESGKLDNTDIMLSAGVVLSASQAAYLKWFKPSWDKKNSK